MEVKILREILCIKNVKKFTFSLWMKGNRFSDKVNFFLLFPVPQIFDICSINAAWKAESNKCISKHVCY